MIVWKGCLVIKIIIVSAVWCPACLIMHSRYDEIKKLFPHFEYIDYDYDLDEDLIASYNVGTTLPVLIVLNNNQEVTRIIGERTIEQIKAILECL